MRTVALEVFSDAGSVSFSYPLRTPLLVRCTPMPWLGEDVRSAYGTGGTRPSCPRRTTRTWCTRQRALVRHLDPQGVHPLRVPTAAETTLRLCVKQRARLIADAVRAKGRIRFRIVLVHPQLGDALGDGPFTEAATAWLRRRRDPCAVRAKRKAWLRRRYREDCLSNRRPRTYPGARGARCGSDHRPDHRGLRRR